MKQQYYAIPLVIFLLLVTFLWLGLKLDPQKLPSTFINKSVPIFSISTVEDPQLHFNNQMLLGHVSLLNIWATWCLSCQQEHPILMDIAQQQQVAIYGLDYKDDLKAAQQWLKNYGNPYKIIGFDGDGHLSIDLGVYGTPETFIIDKQGIIRYKVIGVITPEIWHDKLLPFILKLQA